MKLPRLWRVPHGAPSRIKGWASFLNEVGKIVLGVLIALGLGAIASEIGWRIEVDKARRAISYELGETVGQAGERINYADCVERRLDELSTIIDVAETTGTLPAVGVISTPSFRTWNRGLWDSAVSSQAAAHFPHDEAGGMVTANEFVDILVDVSRQELEVWTRLYGMVGPGRAISPEEIARQRQTIGEARILHRTMAMASIRATQIVDAYDLTYDAATADDYRTRPITVFSICAPIPPNTSPTYGRAPMEGILAAAAQNPITRTSGVGAPRR